MGRTARGTLCPSILLFLLGSFLSWALTATADKKMIKYHGLSHSPIHVAGCCADYKKAALEALFFSVHEVQAFWLLFIKPYVCEAACLKSIYSTLHFWMCLMLESMNAEECKYWLIDIKKNHSRTQIRLSSPFDLKLISMSWLTVCQTLWQHWHAHKYVYVQMQI